MSNIFADLELPVNVAIDFGFFPPAPATKVGRRLEEEADVAEVSRAIQAWYYEEYC
jgi:hypothetical protein